MSEVVTFYVIYILKGRNLSRGNIKKIHEGQGAQKPLGSKPPKISLIQGRAGG